MGDSLDGLMAMAMRPQAAAQPPNVFRRPSNGQVRTGSVNVGFQQARGMRGGTSAYAPSTDYQLPSGQMRGTGVAACLGAGGMGQHMPRGRAPSALGMSAANAGGMAPVVGRSMSQGMGGGGMHATAAPPPAVVGGGGVVVTPPTLTYGYACEQNARWRKYMEDMHTTVADFAGRAGSLYAGVYDGHGGSSAVDFVRNHLHSAVERELRKGGAASEPATALSAAFLSIDKMLEQMGCIHCGTTAAVCLCLRAAGPASPLTVHMANTGDTRCLLIRDGGHPVIRLSVDHVGSDRAEVQRVLQVGGQVINNRVGGSLAVTRALGDHCLKSEGVSAEPHYVRHEVTSEDKYLLMASDGVWDVMSDADAQAFCLGRASEMAPKALAEAVIQEALYRGTRDNLSCLVIKLKD